MTQERKKTLACYFAIIQLLWLDQLFSNSLQSTTTRTNVVFTTANVPQEVFRRKFFIKHNASMRTSFVLFRYFSVLPTQIVNLPVFFITECPQRLILLAIEQFSKFVHLIVHKLAKVGNTDIKSVLIISLAKQTFCFFDRTIFRKYASLHKSKYKALKASR